MISQWVQNNIKTYQTTKQVPYIVAIWFPFHFLALAGLVLTYINSEWYYAALFPLGWAVFGGLGAAITLHRIVSHRSLEIRPWLKPVLLWIGCMSAQGSPIWWAALHRGYHHAHSDKEKDIHSPINGFWHAYMGWMFDIKSDSVSLRHAVDLLKDGMLVWFHKNYNKVVWASLVMLMLIDPYLCFWFYVIPAIVALHTDSMVNSICHSRGSGYRRYETKDHSENVWYLGVFGWGQGWHNNHHSNPRSFDFGTTISGSKREFDPCLLWVPLISPWDETKRVFSQRRSSWAG